MRAGWYISGAGHLALILALLFGGLFAGDRIAEPVSVADVSLVSEAEYAALVPPGVAPDTQSDAPEVTSPEAAEATPETPAPDAAPRIAEPQPVEEPAAPETPEVAIPTPVPQAVVVDTAPEVPAPPTELDGTSLQPDAVAAPAPRVAPVPQVAPPPDAETAPDFVPDRAPDPLTPPEPTPEPEQAPAAPEAASDRIVTEAEERQEYAPASSKRPRARPPKPIRAAETPREPDPETPRPAPDLSDAVAAAVAEANEAPAEPARGGPPLTGGEKDALRVAVGQCWNVGGLSTDALGTTVVVAVEMEQTGRPVAGSIRLVDFSGGSDAAARQAFEAARRAIIRCGARGFPLPVEKFAEWRDIEMTFNPEGMQFR